MESVDIPRPTLSFSLHKCPVCDDTAVILGGQSAEVNCHDTPMVPTEDRDVTVSATALSVQLLDAFEIPRTGTEICYALLTGDLQSVTGIAGHTGYERERVETHLGRLDSMGLLNISTLPCEDGSEVTVYHAGHETLPTTLLAFCLWATWAAGETVATVNLAAAEHDPSTVFRMVLCDEDDQSVRC
jgi:hypothetical protein